MQESIFKHHSGEFYKVLLPRENNAQLTLKPISFWKESSAQEFINSLTVPNNYWRDIVNQCSSLSGTSSLAHNTIEQQVCTLMVQDQLKFYPIVIHDVVEHPPEKRVLKSSGDTLYRFAHVSTLLNNNAAETKKFKNTDYAKEFLTKLNPSKEKLTIIANELDIIIPATASVNPSETLDAISKALVEGDVIIIIDKTSSPPPDKSIIEDIKNTFGNRRADNEKAPDIEFKEINIDLIDEFDKKAVEFYKLFDGLEFTLKTDQGEEHKGTINNGKIQIPKAKMNSSFDLEIKDMPAYMEV